MPWSRPLSPPRRPSQRAAALVALLLGPLSLGACVESPPTLALVHPADDPLRTARAAAIASAWQARGLPAPLRIPVAADASAVDVPESCRAVVWDADPIPPPPDAAGLFVVRITASPAAGPADLVVDPEDARVGAELAARLGARLATGGDLLCLAVDPAAPHAVQRLRGLAGALPDAIRIRAVAACPTATAEAFRVVDVALRGDAPPAAFVVVDPELTAAVTAAIAASGRTAPVVSCGPRPAGADRDPADAGAVVDWVEVGVDTVATRVVDGLLGVR